MSWWHDNAAESQSVRSLSRYDNNYVAFTHDKSLVCAPSYYDRLTDNSSAARSNIFTEANQKICQGGSPMAADLIEMMFNPNKKKGVNPVADDNSNSEQSDNTNDDEDLIYYDINNFVKNCTFHNIKLERTHIKHLGFNLYTTELNDVGPQNVLKIWISNVETGSAAFFSGFENDDELIVLDGKPINSFISFYEVVTYLYTNLNIAAVVSRSHYTFVLPTVRTHQCNCSQIVAMDFPSVQGTSLGFGIYKENDYLPAQVKIIHYNGLASKLNKIKVHDEILKVNNSDVRRHLCEEIFDLIQKSMDRIIFIVKRETIFYVKFAVELHKDGVIGFGFGVTVSYENEETLVRIAKITPRSPADRDENLMVGDYIESINQNLVSSLVSKHVLGLLKEIDSVELCIRRYNHR